MAPSGGGIFTPAEAERFLGDAAPQARTASRPRIRAAAVALALCLAASACAAAVVLGRARRSAGASLAPDATVLASQRGRLGSFLVIGDWGWDARAHGNVNSTRCQQVIAEKMLATMRSLGDVKFIINVGDSFYPDGVQSKSDPQWDSKWRQVFHRELRSVPWYSIYGNHDYHNDWCACADMPAKCAQVNGDIDNLDFFYMPSYNWFREHPELQLEVVGIDMNQFMWAWNKKAPAHQQCPTDCYWTKCHAVCEGNLRYRAQEGIRLLQQRAARSTAKNLVVFSHYPTDYLWRLPEVLSILRNASRQHVEYFGGHRHNVDQTSTISTAPNSNWLVGGGGGWSCDTPKGEQPQQGFVVGEIGDDGTLATRSVLVDASVCCGPVPPPGPPPPPGTPQPFCALSPWIP